MSKCDITTDSTYDMNTINELDDLEKPYGMDITSMMEKFLVDELTKSINQEILLDCISPETKGQSIEERQAAIDRMRKIEERNNKIDDLTKD